MNKFEIAMFGGESICFEYASIVVCNGKIKKALIDGRLDIGAPKPFIIVTNLKFTDDEIEILEDASIADCLNLYKLMPSYGGLLI